METLVQSANTFPPARRLNSSGQRTTVQDIRNRVSASSGCRASSTGGESTQNEVNTAVSSELKNTAEDVKMLSMNGLGGKTDLGQSSGEKALDPLDVYVKD